MESPICQPDTRLIETFGWDGATFPRLDRHLARLAESARVLGFSHEAEKVRAALPEQPGPDPLRLRLTLGRAGDIDLSSAPAAPNPPLWRIALSPIRLMATDPLLHHKTTERALYDRTRAALPDGVDEILFLNDRGELAEGTISNLFVDMGHGLCTPPLTAGCLPGCLRGELIERGAARERRLHPADLRRARLWMGNSLRGLIPAVMTG